MTVQQHDEDNQTARQHKIAQHAGIGRGADTLPEPCPHVLRSHGRTGRAYGHGRHLHIGPQLQRGAIGGCGLHAMLVDHGDHGDHGQRDHHDLHAHGQALDHQSAHNRQIGLEQTELPATYP
ncbi:hypothetical protein SDC9_171600 [bioreactor metagenome]|uniref:Uncharacterized protein n=1 Tax=bioreactor metagenome TaxID=1076179 RepID=A0A645GDI1_9ZZZZ